MSEARATTTTTILSMVYPVVGGAGVTLAVRGALGAAYRFVQGGAHPANGTPPGRSGKAALAWTALSWAVSIGAGVYAGRKLVRPASATPAAIQPAQS